MKKRFLTILVLILIATSAQARGTLSPSQIERVKAYKQSLGSVDKKSLDKTIAELQRTSDPEMALAIQETIAQTYVEVLASEGVQDQSKKEWLYGVVALNMANLQMGGRPNNSLNRMITKKLEKNLPASVSSHPDFHFSVE